MIIDSTIFASGDLQLILKWNAHVERKRSQKVEIIQIPEQFCESESNIINGRETMFLFIDTAYYVIYLSLSQLSQLVLVKFPLSNYLIRPTKNN